MQSFVEVRDALKVSDGSSLKAFFVSPIQTQLLANTTNPLAGMVRLAELDRPCIGGPEAYTPPPLPADVLLSMCDGSTVTAAPLTCRPPPVPVVALLWLMVDDD